MKTRTVRTVAIVWAIIMALLLFAGIACEITALVIAGVVLGLAHIVFQLIVYRCPNCGKFIGRIGDPIQFCPHCGKSLEE